MNEIQRQLQADGWARVDSVFTGDQVDDMADLAHRLAVMQALDGDEPELVDTSEAGKVVPRKLAEPFFLSSRFRQFLFSRDIAELIAPIIGPGADLVFDHIFMKPPLFGAGKHWHQDAFYFDVDPPEGGVTVWVALTDAHERNGCLRYLPGSHKNGLLHHELPDNNPALAQADTGNLDLQNAVAVPARRGDVILHSYRTLHSSGPNRSGDGRVGYASHWVGRGVNGAGVSWYKRYPVRDDYHRLVGEEALRI